MLVYQLVSVYTHVPWLANTCTMLYSCDCVLKHNLKHMVLVSMCMSFSNCLHSILCIYHTVTVYYIIVIMYVLNVTLQSYHTQVICRKSGHMSMGYVLNILFKTNLSLCIS